MGAFTVTRTSSSLTVHHNSLRGHPHDMTCVLTCALQLLIDLLRLAFQTSRAGCQSHVFQRVSGMIHCEGCFSDHLKAESFILTVYDSM